VGLGGGLRVMVREMKGKEEGGALRNKKKMLRPGEKNRTTWCERGGERKHERPERAGAEKQRQRQSSVK